MAENWSDMDYLPPWLIDTSPNLASLLPESLAREHNVLSQGVEGQVLTILIGDPNDLSSMDCLRFILGSCSDVRIVLSSRRGIQEAIERVYGTHEV